MTADFSVPPVWGFLLSTPRGCLSKFGTDEFAPIARLKDDPAAITVKGDAPFTEAIARNNDNFRALVPKLNLEP